MSPLRITAVGFILSILLLGASCQNSSQSPSGRMLTGKVTYQGKTLQYGTVTFLASSGKRHKAAIKTDGTFRLTRPDPGAYKVSVDTTVPPANIGGGPSGGAPKKMNLPAGMEDPEKSGLSAQITEETASFDITVPEKAAGADDKAADKKDEAQKDAGKKDVEKKDAPPKK